MARWRRRHERNVEPWGHPRAPFRSGEPPEWFAKADTSGADAIILDLKDAVAIEAKEFARTALDTTFTSLPVMVRINAHGTPWHEDDVAAIARLPLAGIILPKAEDPQVALAVAPSDKEFDWARRVLSAGEGTISADGAMVDEPIRIRARKILAKIS